MNKFNQFVTLYLKWVSPFALLAALLSALGKSENTILYNVLGAVTIVWIVFLMYLVIAMASQNNLRNKFVRWLAGINENDERESYIAGQASKKTFIFTMGLIIFLLFFSVIRIDIFQNKTLDPDGKKNGQVLLGMGIRFLETFNNDSSDLSEAADRKYFIHYKGLPLATDGTLILVSLLQLGAFYYFSRKEQQF